MIRGELLYPSVALFAKMPGMTPVNIQTRLEQSGKTQRELAQFLKRSKDSVSRLVNSKRQISADEAQKIEEFFAPHLVSAPLFRSIDVFGYTPQNLPDRVAISSDRVFDHIEVPEGLVRGDMIAVRVPGDTMEPRLYSGEIVIVARDVPPSRNSDCLIEFLDGTAIVKQYRGQRDGVIFLWQYNPEQEIRLTSTSIKSVSAVTYRR